MPPIVTSDPFPPLDHFGHDARPSKVAADRSDDGPYNSLLQGDAGDLLNIAPRKPNWDLKRDLSAKMEKLNKRTKYAIVELIKQRIEAESNADVDDET